MVKFPVSALESIFEEERHARKLLDSDYVNKRRQ